MSLRCITVIICLSLPKNNVAFCKYFEKIYFIFFDFANFEKNFHFIIFMCLQSVNDIFV